MDFSFSRPFLLEVDSDRQFSEHVLYPFGGGMLATAALLHLNDQLDVLRPSSGPRSSCSTATAVQISRHLAGLSVRGRSIHCYSDRVEENGPLLDAEVVRKNFYIH